MPIEIRRLVVGPLENNTYVVSDEKKAALVIDPSIGCDEVLSYIDKQKLTVAAILLTHSHFDHIMGIPDIHTAFPDAPVYVHPLDKMFLTKPQFNGSPMMGKPYAYAGPTQDLTEGPMTVAGFSFTVVLVHGHTPGGCALLFGNQCFCGDIIFAGSIGRSDFPGGDADALINGIREKIFSLPDETTLLSGHGGRTTVGREKKYNPFF